MLYYLPSKIACSTFALVRMEHGLPPWPWELEQMLHYKLAELMGCLSSLTKLSTELDCTPEI